MKFSYPSTFIIPCSIFNIGIPVKNIKNSLALMGVKPPCEDHKIIPAPKGRQDVLFS